MIEQRTIIDAVGIGIAGRTHEHHLLRDKQEGVTLTRTWKIVQAICILLVRQTVWNKHMGLARQTLSASQRNHRRAAVLVQHRHSRGSPLSYREVLYSYQGLEAQLQSRSMTVKTLELVHW